jgi:hypothetical protein
MPREQEYPKIPRAFAAARSWGWPGKKSGRPNRTSSISDAKAAADHKSLSARIEAGGYFFQNRRSAGRPIHWSGPVAVVDRAGSC